MNNITRKEIAEDVCKKLAQGGTLLSLTQADLCISAFLSSVKEALGKKKSIELRGFGTFSLKKRATKTNARNPKTGVPYTSPEHYIAHFKAGSELDKLIREAK